MPDAQPRYAEIIVALLTVAGATFIAWFSWTAREFVCGEKLQGDCDGGTPVVVVAMIGLMPAVGMLVGSWRARGHPWRWFLVTALAYVAWGVAFSAWAT